MKINEWVDVNDDMPKFGETVIVTFGDSEQYELDHVDVCVDTGELFFSNNGDFATHWYKFEKLNDYDGD